MNTNDMQDRPLTFMKRADAKMNRIIIPKFFVDRNGRDYLMDIYKDKIVLTPIEKEEE